MYVCMYVCIFIKLHTTVQSGPVILVILCHSHWCMYVCMVITYSREWINRAGTVIATYQRRNIYYHVTLLFDLVKRHFTSYIDYLSWLLDS